MLKLNHKRAQALTELAVFGAILIYLMGTIIRTSMANSMTQNQNFKAMRMAMLESWKGSLAGNISRNGASVMIIEDRLSPDFNKYGDLDRNPYIANGSGTFTYELLYPLTPGQDDMQANMPVMDIYLNGQYLPLSTASFVTKTILNPADSPNCPLGTSGPFDSYPLTQVQCQQNQCLRNKREWVGGIATEAQFQGVISPATVTMNSTATSGGTLCSSSTLSGADQRSCQDQFNAGQIFLLLASNGLFGNKSSNLNLNGISSWGYVDSSMWSPTNFTQAYETQFTCTSGYQQGPLAASSFESAFPAQAPAYGDAIFTWLQANNYVDPTGNVIANLNIPTVLSLMQKNFPTEYQTILSVLQASIQQANACANNNTVANQVKQILTIVNNDFLRYKLFYTTVANPGANYSAQATPAFSPTPPMCTAHPCMNQELSSDLILAGVSNKNGELMYDLLRNGDSVATIDQKFPVATVPDCDTDGANSNMRCNIAWQWAATAATSADMIGLNPDNNQFPTYDVDGRLKEETIYGISYDTTTGEPTVSYSDPQQGDIDTSWDANTCAPRPGLQSDAEVLSFTKDGTYLQIREGKMYNPESGAVVRSVNRRDTIDLISRRIQLSSNTGRFCGITAQGATNPDGSTCNNANGCPTTTPVQCIANDCTDYPPSTAPNPVEVCVNGTGCPNGPLCNCFSTQNNIKSTCFDETDNMLYVRSRLQDLRGNFWMTNTSGQMKVQQ